MDQSHQKAKLEAATRHLTQPMGALFCHGYITKLRKWKENPKGLLTTFSSILQQLGSSDFNRTLHLESNTKD